MARVGENRNAFRVLKGKYEGNHSDDLEADGKMILKGILQQSPCRPDSRNGSEGHMEAKSLKPIVLEVVGRINVAKDRYNWQVVMNAVIFGFLIMRRICRLAEGVVAC